MANPDISLLGAVYSGVPGIQLPTSGGGTATFPWVEGSETKTENGTYDVTNLAEVVVNVSGSGGGGPYAWAGPNATLYKSYDNLTYTLAQTSFNTWTPSTTATQIIAAQTYGSLTVTDLTDYDYYILHLFDFHPVFVSGATLKTTVKRNLSAWVHMVSARYTNEGAFSSGVPNNPKSGSLTSEAILIYYNSSGTETYNNSSTSQGIYASSAPAAPGAKGTAISSTFTIKSPVVSAKCSNSYFSTARAAELDKNASTVTMSAYVVKCERQSLVSKVAQSIYDMYVTPL